MTNYLIINIINGKVYVGKTVDSLQRRWNRHKWDACNGKKTYLHRAMRKYGIENFSVMPVMPFFNTDADLKKQEIELIADFHANDPKCGYNLTKGGDGTTGYKPSAETRSLWSTIRTGVKFSDETRQLLSEFHKANPNAMQFVKGQTPCNKGKKASPDAIRNQSLSHEGKPWSDVKREKHKAKADLYAERKKLRRAVYNEKRRAARRIAGIDTTRVRNAKGQFEVTA
jgi:group I intron endonuclease